MKGVDQPSRTRHVWPWFLAAAAGVLAVGLVLFFMVGSTGPTYAWELNGSFEEEGGGPLARSVSDKPVDAEGFVFNGRSGGLGLDVDLGESYTIEMRVRLDEGFAPRWVKVLDFKDRWSDAGLYVQEGSKLSVVPKISCPPGVQDKVQGCWPGEEHRLYLYGPTDTIKLGEFVTIRFVRDGDTGTVAAYANDVLQTWSPGGGYGTTPEREALERVDHVEDYNDETILRSTSLYVMSDDIATGGDATNGEIDYIHITTR
jgi:hypothetical protein